MSHAFAVCHMTTGRCKCHFAKCTSKMIPVGTLGVGKVIRDHFKELYDCDEGATRTIYYHPQCYAIMLSTMRKGTKRIHKASDMKGWEKLSEEEKDTLTTLLNLEVDQ